jgi:hypothetical protein
MNIDIKHVMLLGLIAFVIMNMNKKTDVENMDIASLKQNAMNSIKIPNTNNLKNIGGVPVGTNVSLPLGSGNTMTNPTVNNMPNLSNLGNKAQSAMPDLSKMGDEIQFKTLAAIAAAPPGQAPKEKSNLVLIIVAVCLLIAIGIVIYFLLNSKQASTPSIVSPVSPVSTVSSLGNVSTIQSPFVSPQMVPQVVPQMVPQVVPQMVPQVVPQMVPQVVPQMVPQVVAQQMVPQMVSPVSSPVSPGTGDFTIDTPVTE